jgi:hypothetical protein
MDVPVVVVVVQPEVMAIVVMVVAINGGEQCIGGGSKFQAVVFELVGTFPPSTVVLANRTCVHVWCVRSPTGGTLGSTFARPLEQP